MKQDAKVSAVRLIEAHEGNKVLPYQDTLGIWTVGIGHNMNKPLSDDVVRHIFATDIDDAERDCRSIFKSWDDYKDRMQIVFLDMAFNMGYSRLKGFKKMINAAEKKNIEDVKKEMLDSKWARQLPERSKKLVSIIDGGSI